MKRYVLRAFGGPILLKPKIIPPTNVVVYARGGNVKVNARDGNAEVFARQGNVTVHEV